MKIEELKKGDKLNITLGRRQTTVTVRSVSPDGKTVYTDIGPVPAANLSAAVKL